MGRCVADTNAIVYFLNQVGSEDYRRRFEAWVRDGVVVSVVTRIEILSWPGYFDRSVALTDAEALLFTLHEEPFTEPIIRETIALRRSYRLKIPDAIVAATARMLALPLITRNTDDFKRISDLVLIDPFATTHH